MAYFEKQYLPVKEDQIITRKQVQAFDNEEPIYLFNEFANEFHLLVHRDQN